MGLGRELKSSKIGSNDSRRIAVLSEVIKLNFSYYALLVDKARVQRDSGLRYKPVFYKFINKLLYKRLYQGVLTLKVTADEIGGKPFMESFQQYMAREIKPDLWSEVIPCFARSINEPLIQLADFIAGTLARAFVPSLTGSHSKDFYGPLKPHEIGVLAWPPRYWRPNSLENEENEWDDILASFAVDRACSFLAEYEDSNDENRQMQAAILNHLLYQFSFEQEDAAVVADRLIAHLVGQSFPELSPPTFRSAVVGPLRDAGIVLSGGSNGYKLARSVKDIRRYLDHCSSVIEPMLSRLQTAREQVKFATGNGLDILNEPAYARLKAITEEFSRIGFDFASPREEKP